jgi:predicted GNAT family acetyltransferase
MGTVGDMDISVEHNRDRRRFEATVDGRLVGFADYVPRDGALAFTHTEVDPAERGQGIGGALVGAALDAVRAEGGRVLPLCSFVADYVARHPAYADLVAHRPDPGGA